MDPLKATKSPPGNVRLMKLLTLKTTRKTLLQRLKCLLRLLPMNLDTQSRKVIHLQIPKLMSQKKQNFRPLSLVQMMILPLQLKKALVILLYDSLTYQ